ncbi:ExbD/TolR family protein [Parvularcula marina]|jgi:biopolymer transport protein ExbD|uniref:Biopolymer transporter ExbD n=1 Tax=Parvularcula marina TaxID=2292771 RepID=A0A371RK50_9PROT|nr:biopolymer transporter ExbD [Parvularcula marina]RFB05822.1 biopolymer transporter ExbD [Parvularcula marina]
MARRRRTGDEAADVNVTPLLDIVFIMLIFFIVTATFVYEDGFDPNLPPDSQDEPEDPPPSMLLTVQADGFIRVDDIRQVDPRSVTSVVEQFLAKEPKGVVIVNATPDARTGTTITVLDQARQAAPDETVRNSQITLTLASGN